MYIETVPNRNSPPAILLREGWREGQKTRKRTLANLSDWPQSQIETLRRVLRGETLVSPQDLLTTAQTSPHGHVEAILAMIRRLDLDTLISSKRCRERDLVVAMIVQRLISPSSKLATTRAWHTTTLAEELGVARRPKMNFTPPWTGCWRARSASRRSWPHAIWARVAWCFTM